MNIIFYPKLAWSGIRKNGRLYTPYILTCTGMVMMYHIITALAFSPLLRTMRGGRTAASMLEFGSGVMAVFAAIFLFYTNSFLIRRRKKEFGLYNILGMGKFNIGIILFWEMAITAAIALITGSAAGMALTKLGELGLVNMIHGDVNFELTISFDALFRSIIIFPCIFALIYLNSLWQIRTSNPAELLHSESTGEKPPKANWFFGILGAVLLGTAYYIAVSIKEPLSALMWFFIAVIMVIIATYLLFIAGSVVLCRILQKNKKYYYKPNHFVSVASMVYRMKRNGAGLASICILATMVLVTISSTTCLYFGSEDALRTRYPRNLSAELTVQNIDDFSLDCVSSLQENIRNIVSNSSGTASNILDYHAASVTGLLENGVIDYDSSSLNEFSLSAYNNVCQVYIIPLSDYNAMSGTNETLESDEAMIYTVRTDYNFDTFAIKDCKTYKVSKILDDFIINSGAAMDILPSIFVIVPDLEQAIAPLNNIFVTENIILVRFSWIYGFDSSLPDEDQLAMQEQIYEQLRNFSIENQDDLPWYSYSCECAASERNDFYATFGGLFFLGIMLSIVFVFAAVLIIYYKQISEGYEDQARFDIMQKVGMTKKDIRKNINSQLLTVFFLPLLAAGIHLAFAFPMISKLLMLFNLNNTGLLIGTTFITFLIFALSYTLVYRITSNAYYAIVSGAKENI